MKLKRKEKSNVVIDSLCQLVFAAILDTQFLLARVFL